MALALGGLGLLAVALIWVIKPLASAAPGESTTDGQARVDDDSPATTKKKKS